MTIDKSIEHWIKDPEHRKATQEWLAERPAAVQEAIAKAPPWIPCYGMKDSEGHYQIHSYDENAGQPVTLKLVHGSDSTAPGVAVFGISPDDMIPCGCGGWLWPTPDQIAATKQRLDQMTPGGPN